MNTVVPPQPPALPPLSPLLQASVSVINPPAALSGLALGARVEGLVIGQAGDGQVQVQTSHGVLTVIPSLFLPQGARLILILQAHSNAQGQIEGQIQGQLQNPLQGQSLGQFRILSINGHPPVAGRSPAATGSGPGASSVPPGAAAPVTLTVGSTVTATFLGSRQGIGSGNPALGATSPASPAAGFQLAATPQTGVGQAGIGQAGIVQAGTGQSQGAVSGPAAAGAQAQQTAQGPFSAGTQVAFRITALQPPALSSSTPAAPQGLVAGGETVTALVTGTTATGQPQILTPAGQMVLNTSSPLPRGTTITLTVTGDPAPPPPATEGLPPLFSREGFMHARNWPNLDDVLQILGEVNPAVANTLANSVIPQPNAQLTTNILFFLTALRGGDLRGWIGTEPVRLMERFKPELLNRLRDDFRSLSRLAEEPRAGDWRTFLVPLLNQEQIQQIRLFSRKGGRDEEKEDSGDGGIRFVVDVTLTRMGRMQLDGLANGRNKRLDLIVRSGAPLDKTVRNDIRRIFNNAAQVTGLTGSVGFQAAPPGFVEASEAPAGEAMGVTV